MISCLSLRQDALLQITELSLGRQELQKHNIRDSLMVRMGACRVPDRGSIPRRGVFFHIAQNPTICLSVELLCRIAQ